MGRGVGAIHGEDVFAALLDFDENTPPVDHDSPDR